MYPPPLPDYYFIVFRCFACRVPTIRAFNENAWYSWTWGDCGDDVAPRPPFRLLVRCCRRRRSRWSADSRPACSKGVRSCLRSRRCPVPHHSAPPAQPGVSTATPSRPLRSADFCRWTTGTRVQSCSPRTARVGSIVRIKGRRSVIH